MIKFVTFIVTALATLSGCSTAVLKHQAVNHVWLDGRTAYILYTHEAEVQFGTAYGGGVLSSKKASFLLTVNLNDVGSSMRVDLSGGTEMPGLLYASKLLTVRDVDGFFEINGQNTTISSKETRSSRDDKIIVVGRNFLYGDKVIDWKEKRSVELPSSIANELIEVRNKSMSVSTNSVAKLDSKNYLFFSDAQKDRLYLASVYSDEPRIIQVAEFDENFALRSRRKIDLLCVDCKLTLYSSKRADFAVIQTDASGKRKTLDCNAMSCHEPSGQQYADYFARSGEYLLEVKTILNPSTYYLESVLLNLSSGRQAGQ